ncbi:MAG TPA: restriction endonuclease subunit S [Candidatus Saccharibacteria bacterium]|nr:restriction endonuclease subunit S [Candidatus Saccharibacteria bacterium]
MTQTVLLGDIADIQTGPFGSQLHQEDYVDEGTPIITVEHLGGDRITTQNLPRVSDDDKQRLTKYWMREGDTIFSRVGSVDRASYVHREEDGWLFSGRCLRVRPDAEKVDPRYLSFVLRSPQFTSYIKSIAVGATMPSVNTKLLSTAPVVLIPRDAQEKVAATLDAIEQKIELNRQMNETLEQMGQVLFHHYFVDNPEAEKWEEKSLDEIADFLNGLAMQKYPKVDGEPTLPVIKIREMSSGITANTDIASASIPEQYIVHNGDLLFSWSGTLLVKFWSEGEGALNQHLFKVTSDSYPEWLYYYWIKHHLDDFISTAKAKATTMGHIQRKHLKQAKVLVPDDAMMRKIGEQIQPLVDAGKKNARQIQTLATLRDTLLPRLVSGSVVIQ